MRQGNLALTLAPLVSALLYVLFVVVFAPPSEERTFESVIFTTLLFLIPVSYLLCISLGWPVFWVLRRINKLSPAIFVLSSAAIGLPAFSVVLAILSFLGADVEWHSYKLWAQGMTVTSAYGAIAAAIFVSLGGITSKGRPTASRRLL